MSDSVIFLTPNCVDRVAMSRPSLSPAASALLLAASLSIAWRNCVSYSSLYVPPFSSNSSCVPCSAMTPSFTTSMRSAFSIVESLWAITMLVRPTIICSRASCIEFSDMESRADVASSRISILGSFSMTLASDSLCFSPPESFSPRLPTCVS